MFVEYYGRRFWWIVEDKTSSGMVFLAYREVGTGRLIAALYMVKNWWHRITHERRLLVSKHFVDELLRRKKADEESAYAASDEELGAIAPNVFELLTRKVKDEKKSLGTASLAIWCDGGSWHASLRHKGIGVRWSAEATTFDGLKKALERAVTQQEGEEATTDRKTRNGTVKGL